ncbi:D-tyrosyl-tRNA(Tyr) deacylase [Candidatus Bipolaricaulota bacterium]|nr:D-tyrosyl-tRNA(Tyr) deacylase [Candidatus Bipolaricaulota bacterium]MBS3825399.1 D-tyrosyl-tRNA(Tyr) deacylase [Candidatus Bipolaricaulota bacterium]
MKALIQVVEEANVAVESEIVGSIGSGLLIFLGVKEVDQRAQAKKLVEEVLNLRILPDDQGKMNLSVKDLQGEILVISQFTLYGKVDSGRRPSFSQAAEYEEARRLYREFIKLLDEGIESDVESGDFGSYMKVSLVNDGPITFTLES